MKKLMTISEGAEVLNVPVERAYSMAREGLIPVVRLGRQVRLDPDQLEAWINEGGKALPGGWKYEE